MLVSLYSARACWVMVPAFHRPPPAAVSKCGTLIFEGTVPTTLLPKEEWERLHVDIERQGFCRTHEARGATLVDECASRYGHLFVPLDVTLQPRRPTT